MPRTPFSWSLRRWPPIASTGDKPGRITLGGGSGLCSQIVNVFLAAIHAEAQGYRVHLDESVALMRHATWPSFWNRYFLPVGVPDALPDATELFYTQDTLQFVNQPRLHLPSLGVSGDKLAVKQLLFNRYIRLRPIVAAQIWWRIRRLNLPPGYLSVKFRRGDKYIHEAHPHVDLDKYLQTLDPLMSDGQCLYAASDDYRCVDELRAARPHWDIRSQPSQPTGFFAGEVGSWKPKFLHQHIMDGLTELQVMADSRIHVALLGSNLCHVVAYMREGKELSTFISLDYPFPEAVN